MILPKFSSLVSLSVLAVSFGVIQAIGSATLAPLFIGAALSFLAAWFWFRQAANVKERERLAADNSRKAEKIADGHEKLMDRVGRLELAISGLSQSVMPISTAFQAMLVKELTHFHTPEMDALMVKLGPPITITPDEMARLVVMLRERETVVDDQITDSERDAAHILPAVIKRSIAETASVAPTALQVVTVKDEKIEL